MRLLGLELFDLETEPLETVNLLRDQSDVADVALSLAARATTGALGMSLGELVGEARVLGYGAASRPA